MTPIYHSLVLHLCPSCYARFCSHDDLQRHELANHQRRLTWHRLRIHARVAR
jgi:hypothetical protein